MKDQAVEVVGDVGERQLRLGPRQADGADEQAEAGLLMGEDVLDGGTDGGLLRVGPGGVPRHRLARRLAPMDAAGEKAGRQPLLIAL